MLNKMKNIIYLAILFMASCTSPSELENQIIKAEETNAGVRTDLAVKILSSEIIDSIIARDSLKFIDSRIESYTTIMTMNYIDNPEYKVQIPVDLINLKNKYSKDSMKVISIVYKCLLSIKNPLMNFAEQEYYRTFIVGVNNDYAIKCEGEYVKLKDAIFQVNYPTLPSLPAIPPTITK